MDFSKLFCHYHPQQIVTNYCNKQQCQIALCANCICIHTKMHMQKGSSPNYQNIRSTYKFITHQIRSILTQLQNLKCRIGVVEGKVVEKRQNLKDIISQARSQALSMINKIFDLKEAQLLREIQSQQKKYGLHCKSRLQNLKNCITRQIYNLASINQNLNHDNFIESLSKIKMQTLFNSQALRDQFSQQVNENEIFNTSINFNQKQLSHIGEALNKIITLNIGKGLKTVEKAFSKSVSIQNTNNISNDKEYPLNFQQAKILFTLRQPFSQQSQAAIGQKQLPISSYQKWNYAYPKHNSNLSALANKKQKNISNMPLEKGNFFANYISTQKSCQMNQEEDIVVKGDKKNYDFTFGKQFKQVPRPVLKQSLGNQINYSGISEKGNYNGKVFNPCFVSNFQEKQINNSIKKMEKKSQKFSKYLENNEKDKDYSQESSQNFKQFMYRTQLL